jgi:Uma2 family endonuclease
MLYRCLWLPFRFHLSSVKATASPPRNSCAVGLAWRNRFYAITHKRGHGDHDADLAAWAWLYADQTPGCRVCSEATWVMGPKYVPQPDIALRILPEYGGQSTVSGAYFGGAPELVVEISNSSSSRDLGIKLELYRSAGVKEYVTILLEPSRVIWRQLVRGRYKEIAADAKGLLRSHVFPGLWLHPAAVWDPGKSLRTAVEQGMKSPEHAAFVRRLASQRKKSV